MSATREKPASGAEDFRFERMISYKGVSTLTGACLVTAQGRSREVVDEMAVRQRTQVCVDRRGRGSCTRQGRCGGCCARGEATAPELRYLVLASSRGAADTRARRPAEC